MKFYYNPKTKKKITEAEYAALEAAEKKSCKPWRDKNDVKRNDPQWYILDERTLKDVASIPFNAFPGLKEELGITVHFGSTESMKLSDIGNLATPGVMLIRTELAFGSPSNLRASAINIASQALYTYVRHINSGARNYEAPDLMIYVQALDALYANYADAKRAYQLAVTYSAQNRNIPHLLAKSMNIDIDDIQQNLADFRYGLNMIARKLSAFCVPQVFNIFKRHWYINSSVFADAASERAQFYVYYCPNYLKFEATLNNRGGALYTYRRSKTAGTEELPLRGHMDILHDLEDQIGSLFYNEDIGTMSGDIMKAFSTAELYTLPEVDEMETLSLTFDENVLQQIENSSSLGGVNTALGNGALSVYQEDGVIVTYDYLREKTIYTADYIYINSHKEEVTPADVMEWTRSSTLNNTYATEIILGYMIYTRSHKNGTSDGYAIWEFGSMEYNLSKNSGFWAALSKFDWHPAVYIVSKPQSTAVNEYTDAVIDLKKYTLMARKNLDKLHDIAIMGCLNSLTLLVKKISNR